MKFKFFSPHLLEFVQAVSEQYVYQVFTNIVYKGAHFEYVLYLQHKLKGKKKGLLRPGLCNLINDTLLCFIHTFLKPQCRTLKFIVTKSSNSCIGLNM